MARHINLSRNELWALLTKVFEALYGHRRDYYDMARTALWLECHGHDGVKQVVRALPALEQSSLPKPELTEISNTHYVLDGQERSLFCLGRTAVDLAMAGAADHNILQLEISNATEPNALIGLMSYGAGQGFAVLISYGDTAALIAPDTDCPTLFECKTSSSTQIVCTRNEDLLKSYVPKALAVSISAKSQTDTFSAVLENGLKIDRAHYDTLNKVANRVLVEATEASRRGAGE